MANFTVSRLGADLGVTGTWAQDNDLFLKVFSGEVLTSFAETNVFMDKHHVRTIASGKSASFPVIGKVADAEYHVPGEELTGGTVQHTERVITIDDLLVTHKAIANIDDAKNHFDVRGIYSNEMGKALARQMDRHVAAVGVNAARSGSSIPVADGGHGNGLVVCTDSTGVPSSPNFLTDGDDLVKALYVVAEKLNEKDVPHDECFIFVRPAQYFRLIENTDVLNRDYGGSGSFQMANVPYIAGMPVIMTNNLPSTKIEDTDQPQAGTQDKYVGDFRNTAALVMHPSAIGTVKLLDLAMEMDYSIRHQATFLIAKYAVGHGVLRPEAAAEIANADKTAMKALDGVNDDAVLD